MSDEAERQRNRERYPSVARVVDEVRKHFPDAKVAAVRPMSDDKKRMIEEYNRRNGVPSVAG